MKRIRIIKSILLLLSMSLLPMLQTDVMAASVPATGISIPSEVTVVGKTVTFKATLTPSNAISAVTWYGWNDDILTVNSKTGVMTGKNVGNAYVTAAANGKSVKCLVRVKGGRPAGSPKTG